MHFTFLRPLVLTALLLAGANAGAATPSCQAELGDARAAQLVKQCIAVSPATRPPCHAANSCQLIEEEVLRGCGMLEGKRPPFCPAEGHAGTVEGTLVAAGGIDNTFLTIRRDDGTRFDAWCKECGEWFDTGEDEVQTLKPAYRGKRVRVVVKVERNRGWVVGPDEGDMLPFVKGVQFIR